MAKQAKQAKKSKGATRLSWRKLRPGKRALRYVLRTVSVVFLAIAVLVLTYRYLNPPITHTIWSEGRDLGHVDRQWVDFDEIAPVMARSVVAAEDANFCMHWGFDMNAIRAALREGGRRGASTITQQTVKNVFLWQDRSWLRKALEAVLTPMVEAAWTKRRILEIYLNIAEFDEGVFGVEAAAWHYFKTSPAKLTANQAARLAVVLPDPKDRNAADLSKALLKRVAQVMDGAATIQVDGRASCFDG